MIASLAILAFAATLVPGFRFRLDAEDATRRAAPGRAPASGIPLVLRTPDPDGTRVDLLVLAGSHLPRWKWTDSALVSSGTLTLHSAAGSTALLFLADANGAGYRVDGPFVWPSASAERPLLARRVRSVSGSSTLAAAPHVVSVVGIPDGPDPLCESDGSGRWQCVGLPRDFAGRVVTCLEGSITGVAEIRPGSPSDVSVRPVSGAVLLRVERPDPEAGPSPLTVRVLRPRAPRDFVERPDPRWTVTSLDADSVWLEAAAGSEHGTVEVSAAGYAAKRLPLGPEVARCAGTVSVALERAARVEGVVTGPDGDPVAGALVLVRSAAAGRDGAVLGDAETDANGEFDVAGLEAVSHRVRACHGEHGCAEASVVPGAPVAIRLPGAGVIVGRVLSGGGVPQGGAVVRILPTPESWASAEDRLKRLPLESRSGADGRFRISAAENGDYLVEVGGDSSGVVRLTVRRTNFSPAITDVGDVRLPEAIEFRARVDACGSGVLALSGPLGGETSLPAVSRFRLDADGVASVRLPEGGAWTAWATCGGVSTWIEPAILPDAAALAGLEVRFERAPVGPDAGRP